MPPASPTALLSLSDRTALVPLATALQDFGYELVATSGTASELRAFGFNCREVEDITGFPAIIEGRVKTLHPKILGGILLQTDKPEQQHDAERFDLPVIDVVAVTLYPFETVVARAGATPQEILDQVDIGGVTLLRAAAKNYERVIVLSDPRQYEQLANALVAGGPTAAQRKQWAADAMARVARYDAAIAAYYAEPRATSEVPPVLSLEMPLHSGLRYGENPWARAAFYRDNAGAAMPAQLSGKQLSYNNLLDVDSCLRLLAPIEAPRGYPAGAAPSQAVCAAIVKHTVPCGFAAAPTASEALASALGADPISAFGGIVATNAPLDDECAALLKPRFLEVVAAPDFSDGTLAALQTKKNLRVLRFDPALPGALRANPSLRTALGGVLWEQLDPTTPPDEWKVVTYKRPSAQQWRDLLFAYRAVRQVKSNAAVVVRDESALGVCGGQTNRVAAVELACARAGAGAGGAVLATDGFFPFADGVEAAIAAGIAAIVAPSGSIRDAEVIEAARRGGIALVFSSWRYFLH